MFCLDNFSIVMLMYEKDKISQEKIARKKRSTILTPYREDSLGWKESG